MALCDMYGRVRVCRFPFTKDDEACHDLRGHAPGVSNATFLAEDTHLVTVGAQDRCVFQWKVARVKAEGVAEDEQPGGKLEEKVDETEQEINPNYELMVRWWSWLWWSWLWWWWWWWCGMVVCAFPAKDPPPPPPNMTRADVSCVCALLWTPRLGLCFVAALSFFCFLSCSCVDFVVLSLSPGGARGGCSLRHGGCGSKHCHGRRV